MVKSIVIVLIFMFAVACYVQSYVLEAEAGELMSHNVAKRDDYEDQRRRQEEERRRQEEEERKRKEEE
uniref:Uncharacterized protein n=1 Tax=Romanomermis culicivorax TaxID=13658 RepID=A0A915HEQ2_ROMCU